MDSVWVFQDLTEGIIRVFAHEEDAKKFALEYFNDSFQAFFEDNPESFEKEKKNFMEAWSADEGMIRLDEVGVE